MTGAFLFVMKKLLSLKNFTKFEIALWLCSSLAIVLSFVAVSSNDILTLVSSLIGITSLIFVAKGNAFGQLLMIVFSVFYGIVSYFFRYYGEMITYLGMTAPIALITMIAWLRHPFKNTAEVAVMRMTKKQIAVMTILTAAVTLVFYFILKALETTNLAVSTVSIATSFFAAYLTLLRSPYYALGYALNDIVLVVLWTAATITQTDYLPMAICFLMFLLNDLYGFKSWRKMQKRQEKELKAA